MNIEKIGGFNWLITRAPKTVKYGQVKMMPQIKLIGLNAAQAAKKKMLYKEEGKGHKVDFYA